MSTQTKAKDTKTASNGKGSNSPAVILFGLDDYEKPKAAWFTEREADVALKAAEQLHRKHTLSTAGARVVRRWLKRLLAGSPASSSRATVRQV